MADFEVFKSFYDEEQAIGLQKFLKEKGLDTKIEKKRVLIDKIYTGEGVETEIYLMLKGIDFSKANQLIDETIASNIASIDPDYYLFSFSDDELRDILQKPDEWNNQDVILARKILSERGHTIHPGHIETVKADRLKELAQPDKELSSLLLLGYCLSIVIPFYGLFFGLTKLTAKKVLPDGSKVPIYDAGARNHFVAMMVISVVIMLFLIRITFF